LFDILVDKCFHDVVVWLVVLVMGVLYWCLV
jgi:hypothetical protein